jgi:hypothetical protein
MVAAILLLLSEISGSLVNYTRYKSVDGKILRIDRRWPHGKNGWLSPCAYQRPEMLSPRPAIYPLV